MNTVVQLKVVDIAANIPARPFLKWVGGKAKLIPQLKEFFPNDYNDYYEPFVGGGALFFSINPAHGHINDMNQVLISAYRHIRDNVETLITALAHLQDAYYALDGLEEKKAFYLEQRVLYNSLGNDSYDKIVLLIFLNKTCFNGLYRENSKGGFNVPFGMHLKPTICDAVNLRAVSQALGRAVITQGTYEQAVRNTKKGDFVYFDPPYDPLNPTSSFNSYHASGFNSKDQEELRDLYIKLAARGCYVMLSNSDTSRINELYKNFNINKIHAARSINSVGSKRGKITEVLITNY